MPVWAWILVASAVATLLLVLAMCRVAADDDAHTGQPRG